MSNSEYLKNYRKENKERLKIYDKNKYQKNKIEKRNYELTKRFGITLNEYNEMNKKQNGLCAICLKPEYKKNSLGNKIRNLSVDHKHDESKKIRGLLCSNCNLLLGYSLDSIEILESAILYLKTTSQ